MKLENEVHLPFVYGFSKNIKIALKRYSYLDILRRIIFMAKQPGLFFDYLKILNISKKIDGGKLKKIPISKLKSQHSVITKHDHHQKRILDILEGKTLESCSPIIVVDDFVFDGHHRIAAMKEAGFNGEVECLYFSSLD